MVAPGGESADIRDGDVVARSLALLAVVHDPATPVPARARARGLVITLNLGIVARVARRYRGRGISWEDLVGEGNLGLIRAVDRFDTGRGVHFGTYAVYWIREAILGALGDTTAVVRLPRHTARLMARWRRAVHALEQEQGYRPTFDDVAALLGLSEEQGEMVARSLARRALWPSESGWEANGLLAGHASPPDRDAVAADELAVLRRALDRIGARPRALLVLRYGLGGEGPMTLAEVGRRVGVTKEWARRLLREAGADLAALLGPEGRDLAV